jgi:hypothetical protein
LNIGAGKTAVVRLHLGLVGATLEANQFDHFDEVFTTRLKEANEFYDGITPAKV